MHVTFGANLVVDVAHDVAGNGEAESFIAARLRQDESIDADDAAVDIHQRPAAVAWIDGSVRLDEDGGIVGIDLPRCRADHAHRDGVLQSQRAAEGEDDLSLSQLVGVGELKRRQAGHVNLQHREIGLAVKADELGFDGSEWFGQRSGRFLHPLKRTRIFLAPCTTCALVTIRPSADKMTPAPMPRCGARYAVSVFWFSLLSA